MAGAVAVGLAAGCVPAAVAAERPSIEVSGGVTQPVFSYADAIREYVNVESPVDADGDGRKDLIRVDIVRPKESGPGFKVPVVMDESPYYDNLGRGNESERKTYDADGNPAKFPLFYDNYFVPRGYAVLEVDMDGTNRSDGCPTSGGAPDVLGGKAVVDWLNGRATAYGPDGRPVKADWTSGHTAMIGKSYDGTLANSVAATGVKGLDAIVPISAISSWYDYSRMNGALYWTGEEDGLADTVDTDPPAKCAAMQEQLASGQDDVNGDYNDFWAERDYRAGTLGNVNNVHAAVLATSGLNDLNVKSDHFSKWWAGLVRNHVPHKVWLSQYGHVDPFDYRRDAWVDTLHRWFDRWLWKIPNGIDQEPRADVELGPDRWTAQADWPAPGAHALALRPQAGGGLGLTASQGTASFTDQPLDEASAVTDPAAANERRIAYTTGPLAGDLRISGTPTVDVRATLDSPTATLSALLVDYGTDTRVNWQGDGSGVRTLAEEDCHGESTGVDDACYHKVVTDTAVTDVNVVARGSLDAQNRLSLSHPSPLTPGKAYQLSWETLPQDYVFKAGHRLGLVLLGSDADFTYEEPGTGAKVSVDLAGTSIIVPVVGEGRPAFGSHGGWSGPVRVPSVHQPRTFE